MSQRHHLVEKLAQAQLDLRSAEEVAAAQTINAQAAFTQSRVLSDSHALGRAVIAWAIAHQCDHEASFRALAAAIAAGEHIALLLLDCWADYPECQVVA